MQRVPGFREGTFSRETYLGLVQAQAQIFQVSGRLESRFVEIGSPRQRPGASELSRGHFLIAASEFRRFSRQAVALKASRGAETFINTLEAEDRPKGSVMEQKWSGTAKRRRG